MRVKFFAVPVLTPAEAEAEVNRFLAQHRVLSIDRQLVVDPSGSCWALSVTYLEASNSPQVEVKKGKVDYREILSPEAFVVFAQLRRLRKDLAERDGVPPYVIFTNEQLAAMVQQQIGTAAELGQLSGVGPARIEKYGAAFLEHLTAAWAPKETTEAADAPDGHPPG